MREIKVREIINIGTISPSNSIWENFIEEVEKDRDDILFDFEGITVNSPWRNESFKKFIKDPRVHMKLHTQEEEATTIETMLMLGNLRTNRVNNETCIIEPEIIVRQDPLKIQRIQSIKDIMREIEDGTVMIDIYKIRSQISDE